MVKKILAFIPTWLLYYIGDGVYRVGLINTKIGYKIYTSFMNMSVKVQDWAKLKSPWKDVPPEYFH